MKNKNVMMGYLFIAPWIIYFLVFILYPFFLSFQNSFLDINVLSPESTQFVGLNNWISVSSDELFWRSLFNVIFNQVIFVLLSFVLAMGMALLLHEITHFGGLFRTIMFIPVITSITVAMISLIFSPACRAGTEFAVGMGSARRASVLEVRALVADAADRRIQHLEVVWYPNDHLFGRHCRDQ